MRKEVFAWAMYDLANTAFSALFVTFFFPFYVKTFLGGNEFQIGLVFGVSMFIVGLLVPFIGAWSDKINKRVPFIFVFTLVCCIATAAVYFSDLVMALLLGMIANFAYHAALTVYNAILPTLGKREDYGKISGVGVSLGYVGTLLSLGMAAIILFSLGWESELGIKMMFPATALFFFMFSLFLFVGVKDKRLPSDHGASTVWEEVGKTVMHPRRFKGFLPYMLSVFMFVNAITAVIVFLFLYGREQIGLPVQSFLVVYSVFSLAAVIGSFYFGKLTDRIGAKNSLVIAGGIWIIVVLLLLAVNNITMFTIAGVVGGIALGAVWTTIRPLLISISPRKSVGQFFGFSELSSKFSGILGPPIFGWLKVVSGYHAALLSLLVFFALGLICLYFVPNDINSHERYSIK
ncbi:MFS transporter [Candidatus Woesearchaeota archaeon]|nr:MFS transporter [Candidatus Woesearchaeota archaeon]